MGGTDGPPLLPEVTPWGSSLCYPTAAASTSGYPEMETWEPALVRLGVSEPKAAGRESQSPHGNASKLLGRAAACRVQHTLSQPRRVAPPEQSQQEEPGRDRKPVAPA